MKGYNYPTPILFIRHASAITTDCNRIAPCYLLGLTFPDFDLATKREVCPLRTFIFGIAPVNKLVSRTRLLWALKSFQRFTLHSITSTTRNNDSQHAYISLEKSNQAQ